MDGQKIPHIEIRNPSKPWSPCSGEGCQHPSHKDKDAEIRHLRKLILYLTNGEWLEGGDRLKKKKKKGGKKCGE